LNLSVSNFIDVDDLSVGSNQDYMILNQPSPQAPTITGTLSQRPWGGVRSKAEERVEREARATHSVKSVRTSSPGLQVTNASSDVYEGQGEEEEEIEEEEEEENFWEDLKTVHTSMEDSRRQNPTTTTSTTTPTTTPRDNAKKRPRQRSIVDAITRLKHPKTRDANVSLAK